MLGAGALHKQKRCILVFERSQPPDDFAVSA